MPRARPLTRSLRMTDRERETLLTLLSNATTDTISSRVAGDAERLRSRLAALSPPVIPGDLSWCRQTLRDVHAGVSDAVDLLGSRRKGLKTCLKGLADQLGDAMLILDEQDEQMTP